MAERMRRGSVEWIGKRKIDLSTVFTGQLLGIREIDDQIWLVSFMNYDLGDIDLEQRTLQTISNPFAQRGYPMSQVQSVTYLSAPDTLKNGGPCGTKLGTIATLLHYEHFEPIAAVPG